ncbi:LysE family translocator [Oceanisphaera avium]|uniref:LysE family translocator n=1 Tax=Oceanisphaera avium TaxID=1903694 RepID=UPI001E585DC1|nr:LysE family transporter [Oceanisphaera avium]
MDFALLISVAGFAFASCATPGPNNMLLTHSAARAGYGASLKLLLGIMLGLQLLLLLSALGLSQLFFSLAVYTRGLKILGSGYLLWLAWQIARTRPASNDVGSMNWHQGMVFQFINPKAWVMALFAMSGFTLADEQY